MIKPSHFFFTSDLVYNQFLRVGLGRPPTWTALLLLFLQGRSRSAFPLILLKPCDPLLTEIGVYIQVCGYWNYECQQPFEAFHLCCLRLSQLWEVR